MFVKKKFKKMSDRYIMADTGKFVLSSIYRYW